MISHAILTHNRGGGARHGRRDRRHAVAQPARRRRLQVQPAARRAGRHRRDRLDRARGERSCSRPGSTASPRERVAASRAGATTSSAYVDDLAVGDRPRRDPRRRPAARRRPARRRQPRLLAGDRRAPRARPRDRQRRARPDVPLRAARLGRQDPHGLLVAVRDGAADASMRRPLRRRVRQRPRRRPPRDRHAGRRAAEPEPPPRGLRRLPVRRRAASGASDVGIGKTLVSSSIIDRVAADLGRRLVEVPVGFKWFVDGLLDGTLGFGGEESAGASFLRRDGAAVEHRQGRADPVPAGGRDEGDDRQRPGRGLRASWPSASAHAAYRRIDVAATPEEKDVLKKLSPEQVESRRARGRADHRRC